MSSFKFLNLFVALSSAIFLISKFLFIGDFFKVKSPVDFDFTLSADSGFLKLLLRP